MMVSQTGNLVADLAIWSYRRVVLQEPPQVKWADRRLLATEAKQLMTPLHPDWTNLVEPMKNHTLACLLPAQAKGAFVYAFHTLTDDKWRGKERE